MKLTDTSLNFSRASLNFIRVPLNFIRVRLNFIRVRLNFIDEPDLDNTSLTLCLVPTVR